LVEDSLGLTYPHKLGLKRRKKGKKKKKLGEGRKGGGGKREVFS